MDEKTRRQLQRLTDAELDIIADLRQWRIENELAMDKLIEQRKGHSDVVDSHFVEDAPIFPHRAAHDAIEQNGFVTQQQYNTIRREEYANEKKYRPKE